MTPLVSIITPTHNVESYISQTIRSVIDQSFQSWELVIVDDASSDNTVELVDSFLVSDHRIRMFSNSKNIGPGPSRNRGVEEAKGRYIAYLDSDDYWHPDKLDIQIAKMRSSNAAICFTSYNMVSELQPEKSRIVTAPPSLSYEDLLVNTIIGCSSVVVDRELVEDLSMPALKRRQPLVLWLRILRQHGSAVGVPEVLVTYRVRSNTVSSNKFKSAIGVWRVYRDFEHLSLIKSCKCFFLYSIRGFRKNYGFSR